MLISNLFTLRSAVGLVLGLAAVGFVAAVPAFRRLSRPKICAVAVGLLVFQLFHFVEHLIQLSYWIVNPNDRPYMTPWAMEGADGLALWVSWLPGGGTMMARGMELLHLVGNLLFLVGILALQRFSSKPLRGLKSAKVIQIVHVVEHVLLTGSVFAFARPLGLSTLFGQAEGMVWAGSLRVWFHFLINLAATVPAVVALMALDPSGPRLPLARRSAVPVHQPDLAAN